MKKKVFKRRLIRQEIITWHRRIGLSASFLLVIVIITGIPLNHVEFLGLDTKFFQNDLILNWYGVEPKNRGISYKVGRNWLTYLDGSLFLDGSKIDSPPMKFKGAVFFQDLIVVASDIALLIFTSEGTLVETIFDPGIPNSIDGIGHAADSLIIIRTTDNAWLATSDFLKWNSYKSSVNWNLPRPLPTEIREVLLESVRGQGLPWSRLLLDLHSGRIFGSWGPYIIDISAVALLILILTGIYNWSSSRR
ncbi:MAG: hypothetical protein CMM55_02630 [Rhodospirillaceae bacterium]|nr:hypothetical protein [Rhodospirillaceae bacterium]|tara:strand:+ start:2135 stop:2881 length:747 start_codon:yes stop_codon:yes gene_type:complete